MTDAIEQAAKAYYEAEITSGVFGSKPLAWENPLLRHAREKQIRLMRTALEAAGFLGAAKTGTVADLTDRLVAASSEWDDNTGDDEGPTSRPYLEHLAKAVESWRPVPAEAGDSTPAKSGRLPFFYQDDLAAIIVNNPGATACAIKFREYFGRHGVLPLAEDEAGDSTLLVWRHGAPQPPANVVAVKHSNGQVWTRWHAAPAPDAAASVRYGESQWRGSWTEVVLDWSQLAGNLGAATLTEFANSAADSTASERGGRIGNFLTAQFGDLPFMVRRQAWQACKAVVEQYRAGDSTADGRKVVKNLVTCPGDRVRVTYENGDIKVSTVQDDGSYVGDEAVYGGRAEVSYVSPFEDDETATGVYAVRRTTGSPVLIPGPDGWPTWEAGDMRGSSPVEQFWAVEPGERVDSTAGPRAWRDDIGCYWDEEPGGRVRLRVPPHYTAELVLPLAEATESYDLAELRPASSVRNTAEGGAR